MMTYKTVTVDVDVYVDDVISDMDDKDLIVELSNRGYTVSKDPERLSFDREDWKLLLELVDNVSETVYTRRVRDKLIKACYGE